VGAIPFNVCVKESKGTADLGVTVMKLNNFKFYKARPGETTLVQVAMDAGAAMLYTTLDCPGGNSYCSFQTKLKDVFYYSSGQVTGIGSVALQHGTGLRHLRGGRELATQKFAGVVNVKLYFEVSNGHDKGVTNHHRDNFRQWWNAQDTHVQGLFVGGILILIVLLCCVCSGLILWKRCCADIGANWVTREHKEEDEIHVMPPVGVDGKATEGDDPSETYSLDDEDIVPEEDEEEESLEDESTARYDPPASYNSRMSDSDHNTAASDADGGAIVPYNSKRKNKR